MATKAAKKTTSKEKFEFLQRERDQLARELEAARNQCELRGQIIESLQADITSLQHKLADQTNTSRHWVLRKLGL